MNTHHERHLALGESHERMKGSPEGSIGHGEWSAERSGEIVRRHHDCLPGNRYASCSWESLFALRDATSWLSIEGGARAGLLERVHARTHTHTSQFTA